MSNPADTFDEAVDDIVQRLDSLCQELALFRQDIEALKQRWETAVSAAYEEVEENAATPHAIDRSPPTLLTLPPELQTMIFTLAYPKQDNLKLIVISHDKWTSAEQTEASRRGSSYTPRAPPAHKVNDWLLSKAFFMQAAKSWIENQAFKALMIHARIFMDGREVLPLLGHQNLLTLFLSKVTLSLRYVRQFGKEGPQKWRVPALKRLHLTISESDFNKHILPGITVWETELEECEIRQFIRHWRLGSVSGVHELNIENGIISWNRNTLRGESMWERNMKKLCSVLEHMVKRGKGTASLEPDEIRKKHGFCKGRCLFRPKLKPALAELFDNAELPVAAGPKRSQPRQPLYPGSKVGW